MSNAWLFSTGRKRERDVGSERGNTSERGRERERERECVRERGEQHVKRVRSKSE